MKRLLMAGVAAVGLAAAAAPAQAAVVGATGTNNSVIGAGVEGWLGATWYLIASAATTIELYFVGIEAGANNSFTLGSVLFGPYTNGSGTGLSSLFGGTVAPTLLSPSPSIAPGLIPFQFDTDFGGGGTVTNASNPQPPSTPNFFSTVTTCGPDILTCAFDTTVNGATASSGNTLLLALDDGGGVGPGPDDDHDDLVMIIKIANGTFSRTPVPEPASLALLGAGLLGLGFAARRRKA